MKVIGKDTAGKFMVLMDDEDMKLAERASAVLDQIEGALVELGKFRKVAASIVPLVAPKQRKAQDTKKEKPEAEPAPSAPAAHQSEDDGVDRADVAKVDESVSDLVLATMRGSPMRVFTVDTLCKDIVAGYTMKGRNVPWTAGVLRVKVAQAIACLKNTGKASSPMRGQYRWR